MCPLKREQARRETQQWVMRRLPTADSIVYTVFRRFLLYENELVTLQTLLSRWGEKVGHELNSPGTSAQTTENLARRVDVAKCFQHRYTRHRSSSVYSAMVNLARGSVARSIGARDDAVVFLYFNSDFV